jgi:hypothetical protein
MSPFATRAVRLMSTAHLLRRDVGRGMSKMFTPHYFPMTLGVTCLGSLLAGFFTMQAIQNDLVRSFKLRIQPIMAERNALFDQVSRTVVCCRTTGEARNRRLRRRTSSESQRPALGTKSYDVGQVGPVTVASCVPCFKRGVSDELGGRRAAW